ncbi:MAG: glycosyltransferase [Planctomycetes bacterium]|nr:glycosyltransferase [Planctomycetota bacterium]
MTDTKTPQLSVVVPSVNGWSDLEGCLAALVANRDRELEILVPDRVGDDLRHRCAERFPEVVILPLPAGTTIPMMRAAAFDRATAPAVAVIEDHVLVPPDWAARMLAALAESDGAVGGAVENAATETLVDRAAYLCEYSALTPPIPAGEVDWIAGNNTIYRRDLLAARRDLYHSGGWENRLHDALKAAGLRLVCRPEIVVGHAMHYSFLDYFSQRYLYARSYAGARLEGAGLGKRLVYGAAAFLLPAILFLRITSAIWKKGRDRGTLIVSLPLLFCFVCAWGFGEVMGYWFGAGDALAKVR